MFRSLLAALILLSATPAIAGIATTTMSVGVFVLPSDPPPPPPLPPGRPGH